MQSLAKRKLVESQELVDEKEESIENLSEQLEFSKMIQVGLSFDATQCSCW